MNQLNSNELIQMFLSKFNAGLANLNTMRSIVDVLRQRNDLPLQVQRAINKLANQLN